MLLEFSSFPSNVKFLASQDCEIALLNWEKVLQTFCTLEASTEFSNTKQNLRENVFIEQHFGIAKPGFIKNLHGERNKWKLFPMQNSFNYTYCSHLCTLADCTLHLCIFWSLQHGFSTMKKIRMTFRIRNIVCP